jgi:glutaredoxin 2
MECSCVLYKQKTPRPPYVDILVINFTSEEMQKYTMDLRHYRSTGFGGVQAEMRKIVSKATDDIRILTELFNKITNISTFTFD